MIDKLLFEYRQNYKSKQATKTVPHSLSKKSKNEEAKSSGSSTKMKHKPENKNFYKRKRRNILLSSKQSVINLKSTSTSSLSSSAEKKYLTPTKYNLQNNENDYYFNATSYNKTQKIFNVTDIALPKLFDSGKKKRNNILLTMGARITTTNDINNINTNNFNGGCIRNKIQAINKSSNLTKNKYVICRKNNFLNNKNKKNSAEKEECLDSNSVETDHNNWRNIGYNNTCSNNFSIKEEFNDNKVNNNINKERKFKNIVLRPHKIPKENKLKNNINIKVNTKYKIDDSPKEINKILTKLNIKPKHTRVFKYG